jgi:hypothetical protein
VLGKLQIPGDPAEGVWMAYFADLLAILGVVLSLVAMGSALAGRADLRKIRENEIRHLEEMRKRSAPSGEAI